MTSRERVLRTLDNKKTDRVPADFAAAVGVAESYMKQLGIGDYEDFLTLLNVDKFIRKQVKRFIDISYDYGCKVMLHSCGPIRDIIPALIEDGLDMFDPVQSRAEGMEVTKLLNDFADRLALHGEVDTQQTLPFGSPDDVRAEVLKYVEAAKTTGGYILAGSQEFEKDVPLENVLAMYEEGLRV